MMDKEYCDSCGHEIRSDTLIVEQTIDLALETLNVMEGYEPINRDSLCEYPWRTQNPRIKLAWYIACRAQELLTNTEIDDYLLETYEEEVGEPNLKPFVFENIRIGTKVQLRNGNVATLVQIVHKRKYSCVIGTFIKQGEDAPVIGEWGKEGQILEKGNSDLDIIGIVRSEE